MAAQKIVILYNLDNVPPAKHDDVLENVLQKANAVWSDAQVLVIGVQGQSTQVLALPMT